MKKQILVMLAALTFLAALPAQSSGLVKGDGNIQTSKRSMGIFTAVSVNFPAEVEVVCKSFPFLEITTDKNILDKIEVSESGGELSISQQGWIEPSKGVSIKIGAAYIDHLETGGYGNYTVTGIDVSAFNLVNPVGKVTLKGKAGELNVNLATGSVDAAGLIAGKALVQISSWGTAKIYATESVGGYVTGRGKVEISGNPPKIDLNTSEGVVQQASGNADAAAPAIQYVNVKVRNNRMSGVDVVIQGPEERRFSYGTSFMGFQGKKEYFPVGTEIYEVDKSGEKTRMLVRIEAASDGKTVNLFR
ncbi:MAG: DUF2807 domain-containing protein [Lewinellaceae bacterium]|nr:DUF2807 domain-containing protein [Lewinella sp.]MCB9280791.1 DUF2807 domain-containing protein [Lewinellaceae bacterium]